MSQIQPVVVKCSKCGHDKKKHEFLDSYHTFCYEVIPIAGGDIYCGCKKFAN